MPNKLLSFKRFFVILDTLVKNTDSFVCGTSKLVAISQVIFFSNWHWKLLEAIHNDTL